jgi:hypothetical protein
MDPKAARPKPSFSIRRVFIILLLLLGSLVAFVLLLPFLIRSPHEGRNRSQVVHGSRQIGLALLEFDAEYGTFPNDLTSAEVTKKLPEHGYDLASTSSNALFRQFFAADITQSEQMFRIRMPGFRRPDDIITPGKLLEPGENGFSYISNLSSKDDPLTPIVLTPLIPGTAKFDPKPFDGKAIILHIDNSVRTYDIHKDGHVYDKGINLLSPANPIWKGKAPDIRYPE